MYKVCIRKGRGSYLSAVFGKLRQVISGVIVAALWSEKKRKLKTIDITFPLTLYSLLTYKAKTL